MSSDVEQMTGERTTRVRRPRRWMVVASIIVIAVSAIVGGTMAIAGRTRTPKAAATELASMEDRYGVRIDLVGLTALGGMVQLRFTVLDKDKADPVFHDQKPVLHLEAANVDLVPPVDRAHKMTLLNGASYFMLYPNSANSAHTGDDVTVVIGQTRFEHITIQS